MITEDLTFLGTDPGAVKFGNFINYYSFHSAKQRIDKLWPAMFPTMNDETIICLDLGCNTGELTREIQIYLQTIYPDKEIHILGVDIDSKLVLRAQENQSESNITFATANVMNDTGREIIKTFLKSHKRMFFNIIFCFSVTMWIHINNGDEGLHDFLSFIKEMSFIIIIEPQPWHCYRNAQRRVKKSGGSFPLYEKIKIRSEVAQTIEAVLSEGSHKKLYESPPSSWNRIIQSYQRL